MRDGVLLPGKQGRGSRLERNARNQSSAGQQNVDRDVLERGAHGQLLCGWERNVPIKSSDGRATERWPRCLGEGCARPAALRVAGSLHLARRAALLFFL